MTDYPDPSPPRALWLVTLADLALLLVGFLVLVQATAGLDRRALAQGFRRGFGAPDALPMPVAAGAVAAFARGSAALPRPSPPLLAWARDAVRDPRVRLTIAGSADGTAADVDPATGSATVLASDRARALAVALAGAVPADRLTLTTAPSGRAAATVTLGFAGEAPGRSSP